MTRKYKVKKVNAYIPESTFDLLEELAEFKGRTITFVLDDAIRLEHMVQTLQKKGGRVLMVDKNGKTTELFVR